MFRSLPFLLSLFLIMLLPSCSTISKKRMFRSENGFRVRSTGNGPLEDKVQRHLKEMLAMPKIRAKGYTFNGDVIVKTVPVKYRDRMGLPFWYEKTTGRVSGVTLAMGKHLPVVIAVATVKGKWDARTLRHECAHVILLWNEELGHPAEYRRLFPLWY